MGDFVLPIPDTYSDGFVVEYDPEGNVVRVVHVTGPGDQEVIAIAISAQDELLVGGLFSNVAYLGTDSVYSDIQYHESIGAGNIFIANYGSSGLVDHVTEPETSPYPSSVTLHANYPNPVADATVIGFRLASPAEVQIRVYDITGRMVDELGGRRFTEGEHTVRFDGKALPSGVYYYRLSVLGQTRVGSMLLVR